jgi:hypothetical protein
MSRSVRRTTWSQGFDRPQMPRLMKAASDLHRSAVLTLTLNLVPHISRIVVPRNVCKQHTLDGRWDDRSQCSIAIALPLAYGD